MKLALISDTHLPRGQRGLPAAVISRLKAADLIVLNDVGRADRGFDVGHNAVTLVAAHGDTDVPRASKDEIAATVWDAIEALQTANVPAPHLP